MTKQHTNTIAAAPQSEFEYKCGKLLSRDGKKARCTNRAEIVDRYASGYGELIVVTECEAGHMSEWATGEEG